MNGLRILCFFLAAAVLSSGCFGTTTPDTGPRGTLRFTSNQPDAILEIDETRLGPIGMFEKSGVLLHPGAHRVSVYKEGHFREYKLIKVVENQLQIVDVPMTPIPD